MNTTSLPLAVPAAVSARVRALNATVALAETEPAVVIGDDGGQVDHAASDVDGDGDEPPPPGIAAVIAAHTARERAFFGLTPDERRRTVASRSERFRTRQGARPNQSGTCRRSVPAKRISPGPSADRTWLTVRRDPMQAASSGRGGYPWTVHGLADNMPAQPATRELMKHLGANPGDVAPHGLESWLRVRVGQNVRDRVRLLNDAWLHPRERTDPSWSKPTRAPFENVFSWVTDIEHQKLVNDFLRDRDVRARGRNPLVEGAPLTSLRDDADAATAPAIPLPSTDAMNWTEHGHGSLDMGVSIDEHDGDTFHVLLGGDPYFDGGARDWAGSDAGLAAVREMRDRMVTSPDWAKWAGRKLRQRELASFVSVCQRRIPGTEAFPTTAEIAIAAVAAGFAEPTADALRLMQDRVDKILARGYFPARWSYNPAAELVSGEELRSIYERAGLPSDDVDPAATYDIANLRLERLRKKFPAKNSRKVRSVGSAAPKDSRGEAARGPANFFDHRGNDHELNIPPRAQRRRP